ncbi:hypothetical protein QBC38DRAFT_412457 [Podospora fimiseda]|uniref:DNA replication ATP-dependent helicase/nuclease n=1 Tax=Podospora fimiseda TaxID=252190 RepID=A0AAN7BTQ8_9PEZI|nr:hypothetical protein QBC38DRAFT_412457 [Podospora fimiseda]
MPPLYKSYSDPTRINKRKQWARSRSNPAPQSTTAAPKPKPPVPVSEKTKNKLQAFQFEPPPEEPQPIPEKKVTNKSDDSSTSESRKKAWLAKINQPTPEPALTDITRTPAAQRPSWQDLLGAKTEADQNEENSPNERIGWIYGTSQEPLPSMSPLQPRRRKRRARSSSPISSPATKLAATPRVNMRKFVEDSLTPRADPALDLWDRFAVPAPATGKSPAPVNNPLFAQLMVSSSPHPARDAGGPATERSFKKSISLGSNWPKRRKLSQLDEDEDEDVTPKPHPLSTSKSFMVSAILESVDDELRKSNTEAPEEPQQKPSSPMHQQSSPLAQKSGRPEIDIPMANAFNEKAQSDYGDDDFDDDTFMELEANISMNPVMEDGPTLVASPEGDIRSQSSSRIVFPERPQAPPVSNAQVQRQPAVEVYEDDFDDLDDDFFDEAASLAAKVEAKNLIQSQPQAKTQVVQVDEGDDEFGDDFGDADLDAIEFAATQAASSNPFSTHQSQKAKAIQRYLITNVLESSYADEHGREMPEKILLVQSDGTKSNKMIHLRGDWYDTSASHKAYVHVIGQFEPSGRCIIDNNHNILILHPDQLVSATVVADSFTCMRRAVLQDRVKATGESTPALVYGTILHEVFQTALLANNWEFALLQSVIDKILKKHVEDLYVIKVGVDDARQHLMSKMGELRTWAQAFVASEPKPNAIVQGRNGEKGTMCVSKLLDVEEHVWSPMYGLKGNIDATVQITMQDGNGSQTLTVPFEVKTGKNATANHQAQTALYNLLLSDRYDIEIAYGILYYMETSQTIRIPTIRTELRHMIMQRNQLACHIRERSVQLPPMKRSKNACARCYAQSSCFIYHKLADDGDGESSGLNEQFDAVVKHLSPVHRDFFLKWEDLLTKEEKESQKLRRELWTMVSKEREKLGRCFANVIIEEGSAYEDPNSAKINRYSYTFIRENMTSGSSFMDSQITVGEPIVVSDEQGHFALALGFVTAVKKQRIAVAVDRRLHNARIRQPGFNDVNNQVFASIMEVVPEGERPDPSQGKIKEAPIRFRLDKDEFSNGMATVRNNLVQLMAETRLGQPKIRDLVVDLVAPKFKSATTQYTITTSKKDSLNVDQKAAVEKVMSARDYALVLGMPGTGKTTTIAHIIRALVSQGKSLLLTSYTHTAVDNILLKLKNDNIPILRLGAPAKIHPEVQDFVTLAAQPMSSPEEIQRAWHKTPVVATTCLGINHPIFNERRFDYCIVDEASQITLPICLGPIRMARTFVLVGDHNQLPPLVQNEEARIGGLDVSLFKLLSDKHPFSVINLEHQYRMSEDIMSLSNVLIYNGRLKCGFPSLRTAELQVPNLSALASKHHSSSPTTGSSCPGPIKGKCYLHDLIHPSTHVSFINTDFISPTLEQAKGNRIVNPTESRIITQLVDSLVTCGVSPDEIGVMTHYRSQLALLKHSLSRQHKQVEMHTADRFQGRDKSVILLSLVRSNEAGQIGELLRDWRRINVAFTRAKTKLLVVGSRNTLMSNKEEMVGRFVGVMEEKGWVYDLKGGVGGLDGHVFCCEGGIGETQSGLSPIKRVENKIVGEGDWVKKGKRQGVLCLEEGERVAVGKENQRPGGKENQRPGGGIKEPKKRVIRGEKRVGEGKLMKGKTVLRDILNDMMY